GGRWWGRRRVGPTDGSGRTGSVAGHREQAAPSATAAPARGAGRAGCARAPRRRAPAAQPVAAQLPVARVLVDVPLAHLDRPFDYLVPERMAAAAVPGGRGRVRVAGQLTGGGLLGPGRARGRPPRPGGRGRRSGS